MQINKYIDIIYIPNRTTSLISLYEKKKIIIIKIDSAELMSMCECKI